MTLKMVSIILGGYIVLLFNPEVPKWLELVVQGFFSSIGLYSLGCFKEGNKMLQ